MSITKESYGKLPNGEEVLLYTLANQHGLKAEIITYGGIIKNLYVKDKNGAKRDIVLGFDSLSDYLKNDAYLGAAVGRNANRIKNGTFEINGVTYHVGINNGTNSLHGGVIGFDKKNWKAVESGSEAEPALILSIISPDGEEGFPGTLKVQMTYTLTAENALKIHYEATSDADTVVNLTNHSYFNLNGHNGGTVKDHTLQVFADFYTPNTSECMSNGEVLSVTGTPFDFTSPKTIGQDINAAHEQIQLFGGYDHNFVSRSRGFAKTAILSSEESGIVMETYTNKPGVQIYTSNSIDENRICKEGAVYKKHDAVCLETQFFPNSAALPHFPSPILKKDEKYDYITEYRFLIQ